MMLIGPKVFKTSRGMDPELAGEIRNLGSYTDSALTGSIRNAIYSGFPQDS